jgi:hypothetical protein
MVRSIGVAGIAVLAGLLLGACAQVRKEASFSAPSQARGPTCDLAKANVLTFGRSTARLYADIALKHQVSELRGYMFSSGLRRIRVVQQTNSCATVRSGGVVSGLHECTARAQLCGI